MPFDPTLFQRSRAPIYLQIAKLLRFRIEQGEWRLGDRIPPIETLMAHYGAARSTLREALAELEAEGLIRRARGAGTFVTKDLSSQRWFKLATDWDALLASIADLRVRLLPIDDAEQGALPEPGFITGTPAGAYRRLRRVHYRQELPFCLIDIWLARDLFDRDREGFSVTPVLTRLAALGDMTIGAARQVVQVTIADPDTASYLGIGVGDPVADVRRGVTDAAGRIIYYARIRYPAQLIEIEMDLLHGALPRQGKKNIAPRTARGRGVHERATTTRAP